jgi:hypothetical protein
MKMELFKPCDNKNGMSGAKIDKFRLDEEYPADDGILNILSVYLDNGVSFTIHLDSKMGDPLFRDAMSDKCGNPATDGTRVYWPNGASLSLLEMISMLQSSPYKHPEHKQATQGFENKKEVHL